MNTADLKKQLYHMGVSLAELAGLNEEELSEKLAIRVKLKELGVRYIDMKTLTDDGIREKIRDTVATQTNSFDPYIKSFNEDVEKYGWEDTIGRWKYGGGPCGCLGPRDGCPFCPCGMVIETAKMAERGEI